jgi:transcriptional regulator with XRE-family HTH domain
MYDLNHIYKVGNLIATLRLEKGLSQGELGLMLGVTNKAVSRWETGRGYPDTALLLKLAEILGITVDELLKGELSSTAPNRKSFNHNINYKAERALFARFSLTLIPLFAFFVWIILIGIIPNDFIRGLNYGETWLIVFFLPAIVYEISCIILGIFFSLKIHQRKDIKLPFKIFICIASFVGFSFYYLAIYIYLIIRLIKARTQVKKSV